ncbi:pentapeptide repeat-containing protein [Holosporaceae bacterium 'Namur']|nr:pentapeptide repeat-containing protein [Holosporaceae bacterium 'Namur']
MRDANLESLNEINIELEEKRKAWNGIYSAIDYFLEGKNDGLLESAVKAILPEEKAKKAPVISFDLIFKSLSFAILHPIHTFNLIKLARSPKIYKNPDFQSGLAEKESITNFIQDLGNKSFMPHIGKYLEQNNYLTSDEVNKLKPALADITTDREAIKDITKGALNGSLFTRLENLISNPKLQNIIKENPAILPRIAKKIIEENKRLKNITKNYKFDNQILDILNIVLKEPQEAQLILNAKNKNNYTVLSKKILELLNDPKMVGTVDFKETSLKELIKKQAAEGLFTNLIVGILEQDKKAVEKGVKPELKSISKKAGKFGITAENIPQFAAILPSIIDESKNLQEILNDFTGRRFINMSVKLLSLVNKNNEIKNYLTENRTLIVETLDQMFQNVAGLKRYNLKGNLYELVPHLLNHSDKLIEIIDVYREGKSIKALRMLREIIKNDSSIREELKAQFEVNRDNIINVITELLEKNKRIPQVMKGRKVVGLVVNVAEGAIQVADKIVVDIENNIEDVKKQKEFDQAMENKIEQTGEDKNSEEQVKYDDIIIDGRDLSGRDFINTSFENAVIVNTSFNGSKFTNASFKDTTMEDVSFKGAVIDAATLKTMVEALKLGGDLNLGGAKLIGDFSGVDLRGISLVGVDLSEAELPDEKAISKVIKANLMEGLKKNMLPHNKNLGEYLIQKFEHEEIDIDFELDPDHIHHVSDYKGNINLLASEIYQNLDNPQDIELIIVSDMIADKITQNLFKEGENRGVDGYNIRLMMKEVVKELSGQSIDVENLIEIKEGELKLSSKLEKIVGEVVFNSWGKGNATGLSKIFYDASKYTGVGLVSGGIYLPEEAFNEQLQNAVKDQLNKGLGIEITKSHQDRYSENNNKNISLSL